MVAQSDASVNIGLTFSDSVSSSARVACSQSVVDGCQSTTAVTSGYFSQHRVDVFRCVIARHHR